MSPVGLLAVCRYLDVTLNYLHADHSYTAAVSVLEFCHSQGLIGIISLACLPQVGSGPSTIGTFLALSISMRCVQHLTLIDAWYHVTYPCRSVPSSTVSSGNPSPGLACTTLESVTNIYRYEDYICVIVFVTNLPRAAIVEQQVSLGSSECGVCVWASR